MNDIKRTKSTPGPKPMPYELRQSMLIQFRVSPRLYKYAKRKAKKLGTTVSTLCRETLEKL